MINSNIFSNLLKKLNQKRTQLDVSSKHHIEGHGGRSVRQREVLVQMDLQTFQSWTQFQDEIAKTDGVDDGTVSSESCSDDEDDNLSGFDKVGLLSRLVDYLTGGCISPEGVTSCAFP